MKKEPLKVESWSIEQSELDSIPFETSNFVIFFARDRRAEFELARDR